MQSKINLGSYFWDLFCIASIIGIWPRYIEHKLLQTKRLTVSIENLHPHLHGLRMAQFSDLHLFPGMSQKFLKKIAEKINNFKPHIIFFTGDLLSHSKLFEPKKLRSFLCSLKASHGCFGVFGNHDYAEYITQSLEGDYDIVDNENLSVVRAFQRCFCQKKKKPLVTPRAKKVQSHQELLNLLSSTPFQFLENHSLQVQIGQGFLNVCGLGDYWAGRFNPKKAYGSYDTTMPGIVLSHNPDTVPDLLSCPGEIILCGHTHGAQVNLPWLWKKFTPMEHPQFKRGMIQLNKKTIYVNRGVGSVEPFRWFSPPELLFLTLKA